MKHTVAQFLPIIIIFLFLSKTQEFLEFSKTVLGKVVAVLIIIFYVAIDKIMGVFVCGLVILFYKTHNLEGMDLFESDVGDVDGNNDELDDGLYVFSQETKSTKKQKTLPKVIKTKKIETLDEKFRNDHCSNNQLIHKGIPVKVEMAEHIFPELQFNYEKCNPCSKTCDISIISNKLETEANVLQGSSGRKIY
jgi:hypothetical protein